MLKTAVAIRHLDFEDLGSFESVLVRAGYAVRYCEVGLDELRTLDPIESELAVVLGGPIGAYEDERYPFLRDEIAFLETRLAAGRPTLGICLGAQLMARALGARVYPGPKKEIGFAPLSLTDQGRESPLSAFDSEPVLHWHGDTFDLPSDAVRLAFTEACENQAFAVDRNVLAVQFHPEAGAPGFERWLIGHTGELAQEKVDVRQLRADHQALAPDLRLRAEAFFESWLAQIALP